jgi:hypothetical protein
MNHRRCYQHAPLLGGCGPIHGESSSAATGKVGWDAAPISMSLGGPIHRESTKRRRRFLIHRESDVGEDEQSASSWKASGLRGLRDRTRRVIHRESSPSCGENLIHRESGTGEYDEYEHSACQWYASGPRGLRDRSGNLIHRESPIGEATAIPPYVGHLQSARIAATAIARYPHNVKRRRCRLSGISIHRESPVPHIHRTAPNDTASMPTRPPSSTLIHRESEHPQEGPTS